MWRALRTSGHKKSFDQGNGVAGLFQPVGTQALEVQAQAVGSQVGRAAFGREQGEASVTGDQMACGLSLSVGPTDPSIAGPQMEGGAGPTQQADPLPVLLDDIAERLADQAMLFEVCFIWAGQIMGPSLAASARFVQPGVTSH